MCSVCQLLLEMVMCSKVSTTLRLTVTVEEPRGKWVEQSCVLEGQFLHEEVDPGVHLKAVKVVGVSLQPHEEAAIRHVGRAERRSTSMQLDYKLTNEITTFVKMD